MKGEIHLWAQIKGVKIGLNQYTNITTCALKVFTSLEDLFKPFFAFKSYSRGLWEFPCQFLSDLRDKCRGFFMKKISHMHNTR